VNTVSTLLEGAETNDGGELDDGRLIPNGLSNLDGLLEALEIVVTILNPLGVPTIRLEASENVFSEGDIGITVNGDMVVIIDANEVSKLEMTGEGSSFGGNAFLEAAVTDKDVGEAVKEVETRAVERGGSLSLGDGETDSIADTLTERTGSDFNARGIVSLWMAWGLAANLSEVLEVVNGEVVTVEVEQSVMQHATMTVTA